MTARSLATERIEKALRPAWRRACGVAMACLLAACGNGGSESDASGVFESTEVVVSAEANGRIMVLDLEEGDELAQGAQVGYVDSMQLYLKKRQLEASLKTVGSRRADIAKQVAATREQIAKAERERTRSLNLLRQDAGTQKQADDAESQLAVLKKQLAAQLSTLERANQGVEGEEEATVIQIMQLNDQLGKCRIVCPLAGKVLAKYAESGEVTAAGKPVAVTAREFHILTLLMEHPKKVFTREQLYQQVWGGEYMGDDNTVNVHISNLRSKLAKASPTEYIKTVWGIGFKLNDL